MTVAKHHRPGLDGGQYNPLSKTDLDKIVDAAFNVLQTNGVAVYSDRARNALRNAGATVREQDQTVLLPRSMVEDAIDAAPSSLTLHSRDGKFDAELTGAKVHYGTGGTAIYVLDPDSGERRPSELRDVALNARVVQNMDHIHLFTINVFPNDVENKDHIDPNRFFHAFDNTTKHVMGGVYTLEGCREVVRMAQQIAGGKQKLRDKPFVSFITLIISPFKIDAHYGDMTCYFAEEALPVVVPTEPICGTTAPVTLAGNVLTHIAETLAGVALVQSVNRGAPVICGSVGSITNLQTMDHVGGAIERAMINAAVAQIARHFQLPLYSTGGTTDAKHVDVQAAYESAMSSLLVAMSGANYIHDIAGLMETDLTVAYEKLVLDNEILGMCQRVLRGFEVNDDTLAIDLMLRKKPGEAYFDEEHTVEHMRGEFFMPRLANRDRRDRMEPDSDALARARKQVQAIRARPPEKLIPPELRQNLLKEFPAVVDPPRS